MKIPSRVHNKLGGWWVLGGSSVRRKRAKLEQRSVRARERVLTQRVDRGGFGGEGEWMGDLASLVSYSR